MVKREQFAVSLRKKKKEDIIFAKRRKILNQPPILSGESTDDTQAAQIDLDTALTIEEMKDQFYQGYEPWRKEQYAEQQSRTQAILFGTDNVEAKRAKYEGATSVSYHRLLTHFSAVRKNSIAVKRTRDGSWLGLTRPARPANRSAQTVLREDEGR